MIWMTGLLMQQELNIYGQEVNTMANTFQIGLNLFNRGMRCDGDPDDVGLEFPMYIKNMSLEKLGSIVTSRELSNIGIESGAHTGIGRGLGSRVKSDGTTEIQKVIDGNIEYLNSVNNTWTSRVANAYTTTTEVYMVDFLSKMYTCGDADSQYLKYNDESGNGTVTGNFEAKFIAVVENQLFMVDRNLPRVMFWSRPNTDQFYRYSGTAAANADVAGANTITTTADVFRASHLGAYVYNATEGVYAKIIAYTSATVVTTDTATTTWDNDSIYVFEDFFIAKSNITALASVNERIAVFDAYNLYLVDITNSQRELFSYRGTLSQRCVAVNDNGELFWGSPYGFFRKSVSGAPEKISNFLNNRAELNGVFNLIEANNFSTFAGGIVNDDYVSGVGSLSAQFEEMNLQDLVLCFNNIQNSWRTEEYTAKIFHRAVTTSGNLKTYCMSSGSGGIVYDVNGGDYTTVDWELVFWNTTLGRPSQEKTFNIDIRYRSSVDFTIELSLEHGAYGSAKTLRAKDDYTTVNLSWGKTAETIGLRIYGTGYVDISSFVINGEVVGHHGKIK